ncbi:MFS transporter [Mucilaginibacter sp. BJC16-A38]|uniref:MFS transporter n=1 Tax=Mucilaginibacter phenanthrenivorans TaxID=1234842 RepID=UPI002157C114|nr:MFS transporter [Mucilaginibacter phenanthrenivorans]MCR8557311.1 MFS transporter [Mucilaginibacter phenanthrenivorans]
MQSIYPNPQQNAAAGIVSHPGQKKNTVLGIAGLVLVALALRPSLVSVGPVLPLISQTFHLSHTTASLLTAIPDLLMGLMALPTPWLAHRLGRDKLIIIAMFILSVSTVARAFSPNPFVLLLTTAGVGTGIAVTGALLSGFIKSSYANRAVLVMGVYTTALCIGSTIPAFLTAPIASLTGSWRFATGIYALLCFIGMIAWYVLSRHHKNVNTANVQLSKHVSLPWRNLSAWKIAIFFACNNLLFYALLAWLPLMFLEAGKPGASANSILGYLTSALIVGTPAVSALSRSHDRRIWLACCSLLTLAGILMIAFLPSVFPEFVVFFTSLGLAGTFTLGMTLPLDNTNSPAETNAWTAFTLLIGYLIAATGPLCVGILRDLTGSFSSSYFLLISVSVIMLLLSFTLKPPAQKSMERTAWK